MGTWGYKSFENDGAADWLYDLQEASDASFCFDAIKAVTRSKGKVDLDDALEGLAAAEILYAARYDPPRGVPASARNWIRRVALVPRDGNLKLAIRAVTMVGTNSELADSWKSGEQLVPWKRELEKLSKRLRSALGARPPVRKLKAKAARETLAELILAVAEDPTGSRRAELQKKLATLSSPDRPVGGKWKGESLNRLAPLHWVASRGLLPEAKILVQRGASVNLNLPPMSPPIDFAMDRNHLEMVAFLLEAGADRQKALFSAIRDEKPAIMKMILALGVNVNAKKDAGWTPVLWAAHSGSPKALELLLEHGGKLRDRLETGDTALHLAAEAPLYANDDKENARCLATVKLLLGKGAKVNVQNYEGKTPLDVAEEIGAVAIVRVLRRHGAKKGSVPRK